MNKGSIFKCVEIVAQNGYCCPRYGQQFFEVPGCGAEQVIHKKTGPLPQEAALILFYIIAVLLL